MRKQKPTQVKNSRKGKRFNSRQSITTKIERMEHPPQIDGYEVTHSKRLRFTVTMAAAATGFTYENLLDTILVATAATVGYDLFDIVRVRSVEVWSQAALGTPSTVTVVYTTATGDRSIHTDTSLGVKPAYVLAVPDKSSLASFWSQSAGGNPVFTVTCPAGSIVDVLLDLRTTGTAPVPAANALVGATVGEVYYRGLDGLAIAGSNFPPVNGVPTI